MADVVVMVYSTVWPGTPSLSFRMETPGIRAFSFSCLVGKAHHVESFAEMGIVAA